jgi:hypothetical protein
MRLPGVPKMWQVPMITMIMARMKTITVTTKPLCRSLRNRVSSLQRNHVQRIVLPPLPRTSLKFRV